MTTVRTHMCFVSTLTLLLVCSSWVHGQWENRRTDLPGWEIGQALDVINSNTAVISITGEAVFRTTDAGLHWVRLGRLGWALVPVDVSAPDTSAVWAALGDGSILKWEESNGSWQEQYRDTNVTIFMNYVKMFDAQHGIAMGDAKNDSGPAIFLRTTDAGAHWVSVNDSAFGWFSGDVWRRVDFPSLEVGYFFESGFTPQKLYKTTDGCRHWKATALPETLRVEGMKFYDAEVGLAYTYRLKNVDGKWIYSRYIARTADGGDSWQVFDAPRNAHGQVFAFLPKNPAKVWMSDNVRLYFSADTGRTWVEELDKGARDIQFSDPLHGWMLGDKGVIYYTATGGGQTVAVTTQQEGVSRIALGQNYPNPFNPATTLRYSIPQAAHVTLLVFNTLGQNVAELARGEMDAGHHEINWNAVGLASGIYYARLTVTDRTGLMLANQIAKLVLMK